MSEPEPESLLEQIDRRLSSLAAAEKPLKKPSTISFADRRSFLAKAGRASEELRAQRAKIEEAGEEGPGEELQSAAQAALDEADKLLTMIGGSRPSTANRGTASKSGGLQRRGVAGGSQVRPPDRVGE